MSLLAIIVPIVVLLALGAKFKNILGMLVLGMLAPVIAVLLLVGGYHLYQAVVPETLVIENTPVETHPTEEQGNFSFDTGPTIDWSDL